MTTIDRLKAERDAVIEHVADMIVRAELQGPNAIAADGVVMNVRLDALIEKALALGAEPLVALPCYRINWQRETRELDCRALLRTMTSQPFEAVRLCPRCAATGNKEVTG